MNEASLQELIGHARGGDAAASAALIDTIYPELQRLARHYLAGERPSHTLQTNDLIHEAWLRLFSSAGLAVNDRNHLVALMATQMRRALVDYARHRNAAKGPGAGLRVTISDASGVATPPDADVVELDQALQRLESIDPRAGKVIELRFFGGLSEAEAAAALDISVATLKRDWSFARAWLLDHLRSTS